MNRKTNNPEDEEMQALPMDDKNEIRSLIDRFIFEDKRKEIFFLFPSFCLGTS